MSRYIDTDILKDKTTRVNNIWNGTTNAEGKGLDEIIDDIPTADVRENVKGEWILRKDTTECSNCHTKWRNYRGLISTFSFCPDCGADMRGEA